MNNKARREGITKNREHILRPAKNHIKQHLRAQQERRPSFLEHVEPGLGVKEDEEAVGDDVDHGELVGELCGVQEAGVEGEGADADEGEHLI